METNDKPWLKIQPTFRVYPSTVKMWRKLRENGVDVASFIDDQLKLLSVKKNVL